MWRKTIPTLILASLCVCVIGCQTKKSFQQKTSTTMKSQDAALATLRDYLQLRLFNADWKEYSKFIMWPDEPGWDCNWVVSDYEIGAAKKVKESVLISVVFKRLGLFCYDFEFKPSPEIVTITYELINRPSGWKVNAPIPDYPDISSEALMRLLRSSANDLHESSERRTQFSATARKLADALK